MKCIFFGIRKKELFATTLQVLLFTLFVNILSSCKKFVEISEPTSTIPTSKVFNNDAAATQAMAGVYYFMINNSSLTLSRGGMTIHTGFSSDEIVLYDFNNTQLLGFYENSILSSNSQLMLLLWRAPYSIIYHTNAIIEALENSKTISDSVNTELIAEARFVRAFMYFNLVNLFGNIPYPTSTDWRVNGLLSRTPVSQVYEHIIEDLNYARENLQSDYTVGNSERIIPNKYAATALLARVYLYTQNWEMAKNLASQVINSQLYALEPVLTEVFKKNSTEAIWQLQQDNKSFTFNGTGEGVRFIPIVFPTFSLPPFAYVSNSLLKSFEENDLRKTSWLDSIVRTGITYYYPYKYKIGQLQISANGNYTEYYMVLRLAEQYLIRAEANVMQNNFTDAIKDINEIRRRANLQDLADSQNQQQLMDAIEHERRIEYFAEWGHRWLDLKRWNKADETLGLIKGSNWQNTDQLYPIPQSDLQTNPNLTQNLGYNP